MKRDNWVFYAASYFLVLFLGSSAFPQRTEKKPEYQLSVQDSKGNEINLYRNSYALVIGVAEYTAGWPKLAGVSQDVTEVGKALTEQGFEVTMVKDPNRNRLLAEIEGFISKYGHELDNRLLFYFAGHGHTIKLAYGGDMGYIVPTDAPNPNYDKQGFLNMAVDMRRFDSYARAIESKHAMFLFDSCFSGSIFAITRAVPEVINYKTSMPVRQFITAGSADEAVPDESIFKTQFISGLRGEADRDKDGYVTGTELGEFLQTKVVNYSEGSQHPQYGKIRDTLLDKGDFVFVLKKTKEEQVEKRQISLTSEMELEYWRSIKDSSSAEAFEIYLKRFPNGFFSEPAKQKVRELKKEIPPSPQDTSDTVRLNRLPKNQISDYNEKIKQLIAVNIPIEISIQGQVNLTLSVNEKGEVLIESINESELKVMPEERREFVMGTIRGLITRILLNPPKNRDGRAIRIAGWNVSYSCELEKGKLVLRKISLF